MITNSVKEPREQNVQLELFKHGGASVRLSSQLLMMVSLAMTVAQALSSPVLTRDIVSSRDTGSCSVMKSKGGAPRSLCHHCH